MTTAKPLRIAIVGSGTAGLAAALFLDRDGHDVTLHERFAAPRPIGAGILLQPTGLACLACLGLDTQILERGAKIEHLEGRTATGRTVFNIRYGSLRPYLFGLGIHRGALFSILHGAALERKIRIVSACEITTTSLRGDGRIIGDKNGGEHGAFDLVIDASGTRSALRAQCGDLRYHRPYPYGAVWGVCADPGQAFAKNRLQQRYDGASIMIGALAIGKQPASDVDMLAFFWSLPVDAYQAWRDAGMAAWRERVRGYWPELSPLLTQFQSPDDLTFAQYSDTVMRRWHADRLVFIGDAAHSTSPQLGQGANLGLADALTLAACLRGAADTNAAIAAYSSLRRRHVGFYQVASRWLTPFFQSDSAAAAWLRDRTFGRLCRTPYVRTQMLRTLAGIKTGLFTHMDPGLWDGDYGLHRRWPAQID